MEVLERDVGKDRRHWTVNEKIKLLRRHLLEKVAVSTICDEAQLAPSVFHRTAAAAGLDGNVNTTCWGRRALDEHGYFYEGCPHEISTANT